MSLPVFVAAYSGYKANERPLGFTLDDHTYEIVQIEDRWYDPNAAYFRVRTSGSERYILKYEPGDDRWTLQSGLDGNRLLSRPSLDIVTVSSETAHAALGLVRGCEHCCPDDADVSFGCLLAEVTCMRGTVEFILSRLVTCPACGEGISEKTKVSREGDR